MEMCLHPIEYVAVNIDKGHESSMPQKTGAVVHPAEDEEVQGDHTNSNPARATSAESDHDPNRALSLAMTSALSIMCFTLLVQNSVGRELVLSLSYMCFFAAIFDLGFGYLMLFRRGESDSMITTCIRFAVKLFILFALGTALFCSLMASIVRLHA